MLQDSCDLDVKNVVGHTPLYVAAVEGYGRIVERIVGYGASVSALTIEGNTALHAIMNQKNMRPLSRSTPELQKVHDHLSQLKKNGSAIPPYVVVALFLLREGADLNAKNINGLSPLHTCPPDLASLLKSYYQEKHDSSYRGSLPRFTPSSQPRLWTTEGCSSLVNSESISAHFQLAEHTSLDITIEHCCLINCSDDIEKF